MSGPALGVSSQAIKLWLKSVCSQLEQLDLKLQGSLWRLLQGHLAGATVRAHIEINRFAAQLHLLNGQVLKNHPLGAHGGPGQVALQ